MADDTTMTPVEGAEPPKANPLAKPAASASSSTLKLKPIERADAPAAASSGLKLPPKPGLSTAGLKLPPKPGLASGLKLPPKPGLATQSGLKLPPKPGLATQSGLKLPPKPGLASGLKLPPKPGLATQSGLKLPPKPGLATQSGLKLPPKPGLATQSGLKLPPKPGLATQTGLKLPTKPVIRKPGTGSTVVKPVLGGAGSTVVKPVTAAAAAPTQTATVVAPAEPVTQTAATMAGADLTPVTPTEISKVEKPLEALKSATQNLKSITAPVPQQAILRKTGMLAEGASETQKQAAKSKTSRISLSEAMGAAPVLNENAPMKTIRIKRPIDIPGATKPDLKPVEKPEQQKSDASVDTEASTVVKASPSDSSVTLTQRKTLKISRPSGGVVRPSGKFGIKRPGTMMTAKTAKPAAAPAKADEGAPKAEGEVADIPDIPSVPTAPVPTANVATEKDLPKGVSILGIIVQAAACAAMGALAWWLYSDTQILPF